MSYYAVAIAHFPKHSFVCHTVRIVDDEPDSLIHFQLIVSIGVMDVEV
jgi:hypothetical protein